MWGRHHHLCSQVLTGPEKLLPPTGQKTISHTKSELSIVDTDLRPALSPALSHIGLGFSAKEDDGQCLLEGGGLAFRWAEAAALAGGRSCSSTEKTQLSEGQAWAASTRSGPSF